jgi:hypothetical protein
VRTLKHDKRPGAVTFTLDGRELKATLTDELVWECADAKTAEALNTFYPVDDDSPSLGVLGSAQVNGAARILRGKAEFPPRAEVPPTDRPADRPRPNRSARAGRVPCRPLPSRVFLWAT